MSVLVNIPLAHAFQSYCWASLQGLEGAHDRMTAEISEESLHMIRRAHVSERLTIAAGRSLYLMVKRRGERRGAV